MEAIKSILVKKFINKKQEGLVCCKRNNSKKEGDINLENQVENYQNNMVPTGLNTLNNTINKDINEEKKSGNNEKKNKRVCSTQVSKSFHPKSKKLNRVTTAITSKV